MPTTWHSKPPVLFINLRCYWICFGHGGKSLWDRLEADFEWQQPIHARFDIRLYHCNGRLYLDADELFQQSA